MSKQGEPTGRSGYQRSTNGLVGALLITVLAVVAFVGFRAVTRDRAEVKPEAVDYLAAARQLQENGRTIVHPPTLPADWIATSIDVVPGDRPAWGIGMLTDDGKFVGLRQEDRSRDELLSTYVDELTAVEDPLSTPDAIVPEWEAFSDEGGDHAFAAELGEETLLVFGSAPVEDLETLIDLLTTDPVTAP